MNRSTQHAFEPEEIMAYLDGELKPRPAASLAGHLDHCPECQTLAAQLRQISERLLDFQIEPCPAKSVGSVLPAIEQDSGSILISTVEIKPRRRRGLRILAWATGSAMVILLALFLVSSAFMVRHKIASPETVRVAQEPLVARGGMSVDKASIDAPPSPPTNGPSRSFSGLVTLAQPGIASDSNRNFYGLGDHAENSFNVDGQPGTGQLGKLSNGPMIVQTASITILAANYERSSGAIQSLAAKHSGYVQDISANSQTGSARSLSATLRVPEMQLEALLADLRKLGHVEQETHNNQEITDQYVDLDARLKTSRAAEQRILELLKTKTGNLNEVLQAEEELARIRGEIERMDGERAHMEHQVRYATVQVQLNEEYREQLNPESFSTGRRLRNSLVEGLGNLAGGITGAAMFAFAYGPSILFWLALFGVPAWFIWRRFKRLKSA